MLSFSTRLLSFSTERNGKLKLVFDHETGYNCLSLLRKTWTSQWHKTRGTCHAVFNKKRLLRCCYSSCCSVCDTSADRDPLRKMYLKRLNTGPGGIRPRLFGDQTASTVQTNGDLETSWTAADSRQTVSWQNDVTICLEIDCFNVSTATGIIRVIPATPARTSRLAAPAVTVS